MKLRHYLFFVFGLIPIALPDQRDDRLAVSGLHLRVAIAQVYI